MAPGLRFSLDWALVPIVAEAQWNDDEDEIKDAHNYTHRFGHFPLKGQNGKEDEEKHEKQ